MKSESNIIHNVCGGVILRKYAQCQLVNIIIAFSIFEIYIMLWEVSKFLSCVKLVPNFFILMTTPLNYAINDKYTSSR